MATFSSKGPTTVDQIVKPDIVAPNNTLAATYPSDLVSNSYYQTGNPSGTSSVWPPRR